MPIAKPGLAIVRVADRPDLVPLVAGWLWDEFWQRDGYNLEQVTTFVAAAVAAVGPNQCFVLLEDGKPVGTASLTTEDLVERPDLTPWLAGVFVVPEARGRGLVRHLIGAVEAAASAAGCSALWLYTRRAEPVYLRAGWLTVERVERSGKPPVALMRRELMGGA